MKMDEIEARRQYNKASGVGDSAGWTLDLIRSMPGHFRPPWYHPLRRWAWNRDMLSASGDVIFWERFAQNWRRKPRHKRT